MKIKGKLFLLIACLIGMIVILTGIFDRVYLEKYYIQEQKEELLDTAEKVKFGLVDLDQIGGAGENIIVEVLLFDFVDLQLQELSEINLDFLDRIRENDKEYVYRTIRSGPYGKEVLVLFTRLDEDNLLLVGTTISSIKETVNIINRLHARIIIIIAIVGIMLCGYISNLITKPIINMSKVAKNYARLDFCERVGNYKSTDEIGELGASINTMALSLKESIATLENANKRLLEDIEREKNIDKMRREFISNVSHELKTPIAIISNYIEGIKDGIAEDKETLDFYLDIIDDETNSMNELVHKLLFLSKLETKFDNLRFEEIPLKQKISDEITKFSHIISERELTTNIHLEDLIVNGDKENIRMVIKNLISNSIKYSNYRGYIEIKLDDIGGNKRFSIKNSLEHIVKEPEKLWEAFYREDEARNRQEGTGLGLAIVKEVLEMHGYSFGIDQSTINNINYIEFWFQEDKKEVV